MMTIREFAEAFVILEDDFEMTCYPASEVIENVRATEEAIEKKDISWIIDYLIEEIEEYDGDPHCQDHADEAKRLMEEIGNLIRIGVTRSWKVYGAEGHRQRESFCNSYEYDFSNALEGVRIIKVDCADKTGTNDYVIIRITRNNAEECERELDGQISDGIFENSRVGYVEEVTND